jgi:hypothetical protein
MYSELHFNIRECQGMAVNVDNELCCVHVPKLVDTSHDGGWDRIVGKIKINIIVPFSYIAP